MTDQPCVCRTHVDCARSNERRTDDEAIDGIVRILAERGIDARRSDAGRVWDWIAARAAQPRTPTAVEAVQAVLDDVGVGADRFTYVQEWWAVRDRLRAALAQDNPERTQA